MLLFFATGGRTHMIRTRMFAALAASSMLAACGGGGGSGNNGGGGGSSVNNPPSFSVAANISTPEQAFNAPPATLARLTASDPDGDNVSFQILNTKDGALFSIVGGNNELQFQTAPSFETPRDGDRNNRYELDIRASDGIASVTRTVTVEVTDTLEGLIIRPLVQNLNNGTGRTGGALQYLDNTNELLVVNASGRAVLLNPATGAVKKSAEVLPSPLSQVLDIAIDDLDFRDGNFFMLVRAQGNIFLVYANIDTGSTQLLWGATVPASSDASLTLIGNTPVIAIGDADRSGAAQNLGDPRGKLIMLTFTGDFKIPSSLVASEQVIGVGLRSPRLPSANNLAGRYVIDRGEAFNEYSRFPPNPSATMNFEWPARDGLTDLGYTGMVSGLRVAPTVVQEIGTAGAGRWLDAADSLQGEGWFGLWVISDDLGNIFTYGEVNGEPLERRTTDFRNAGLSVLPIVSMDDGDFDVGNRIPIYMMDEEGSVFVVDLNP